MSRTVLSKEIFEKFFQRLSQDGTLTQDEIQKLRELHESGSLASETHLDEFFAGVVRTDDNTQDQNA